MNLYSHCMNETCSMWGQMIWMLFYRSYLIYLLQIYWNIQTLHVLSFPASARLIKLTGVLKALSSDRESSLWSMKHCMHAYCKCPTQVHLLCRSQTCTGRTPLPRETEGMRIAFVQLYCSWTEVRQSFFYFNSCLPCFTFGLWNSGHHSRRKIPNWHFGIGLTSNRFI